MIYVLLPHEHTAPKQASAWDLEEACPFHVWCHTELMPGVTTDAGAVRERSFPIPKNGGDFQHWQLLQPGGLGGAGSTDGIVSLGAFAPLEHNPVFCINPLNICSLHSECAPGMLSNGEKSDRKLQK